MKRLSIFFALTSFFFNPGIAQSVIEWQNTIGGSGYDLISSIQQTADGGFIVGSHSSSNGSADKSEDNLGASDYWIVKLNASGNIEWENTIGGSDEDRPGYTEQTSDGGYIVGGYSNSNISFDKTENRMGGYGDFDYWIVKLDASGTIQWQNTIGGTNNDFFNSIHQTSDGGYIIGGHSESNISGNKTEDTHGGFDYWIIRLDSSGNIVWQKTIGGAKDDELRTAFQTSDGGYFLGGLSHSDISGDKTENTMGYDDYWVIKLDENGNIQWENTIGGISKDELYDARQTTDGGYILAGWSQSNSSADKTEDCLGSADYWVVKLDASGNVEWDNTIGGSDYEELNAILQTPDGGYFLSGFSQSNISGDKTSDSKGARDIWILKLNDSGNIEWQSVIGGSDYDYAYFAGLTTDGGYVLGGVSYSNISGDKTEDCLGQSDYWIIKLTALPTAIPNGEYVSDISVFPNPAEKLITVKLTGFSADLHLLLKIADVSGREVYFSPYEYSPSTLSLNDIPSGIYFLRITDSRNVLIGIQKLVLLE